MARFRSLTFFAGLVGIAGPAMAGAAAGWDLEANVKSPSYAVAEPTSTDLNIDTVVLSCEQGPGRRGLQLRLYLSGAGPLAPKAPATLKDDPRVELVIDGVSQTAEVLFADDFVVVADSTDGTMPLLSDSLLDKLQAGHQLELRFDLVQEAPGQAPSFDGSAVVDLQAGSGGRAVTVVRRCADEPSQHLAETPRGR